MTIRKFASALIVAFLAATPATSADRPPNVLMICIDDLNDWIGCLGGHPQVRTPNIDALASRGRLFTNAHCSVTVCSPSRISIQSGVGPTTHGSYELGPAYETIPALDEVPTMQGWFRRHGYRTLAGGKVLHHGFRGRLSEDIDVSLDKAKGKGGPRPKSVMNFPGNAWDWGPFPPETETMFDYQLAETAAEILRAEREEPFFLSVGLFRPHVPMFVPPKWFDFYDEETVILPGADPGDMEDVPSNFQYRMGVAPTLAQVQEAGKWRSLVRAYLANTTFVDHCVGVILEGLEQGPHRENTLVVLWSDHGFHLGEKQHIAKRTLWEESTRVPLIFAGPEIRPGSCGEPASLLDLYPTLVEECRLPVPGHLEGTSLSPQLRNAAEPRDTPAISSSYFGNHAVRSRDWRYIRYADGAEELYDHRVDPGEETNLAGDPALAEEKKRLAAWLPAKAAPEVKPRAQQEQFRAGVARGE